jgi:O-antigen ligase
VILALASVPLGDRPSYWRVAAIDAVEHPLLGSGAGSYDDVWLEERRIPAFVRDAHSVYLETIAELGPVGLLLLVGALGVPLVAVRRARGDAVALTAGAAYCAFLVHAGLDWDWEMPVTVLAGLACAASLLGRTSGNRVLVD